MRLFRAFSVGLAIFFMSGKSIQADPIQLFFQEIVGPDLNIFNRTVTLPDPSHGGSVELGQMPLGATSSFGQYPYPPPVQSVNGLFGFQVGEAAPPGSSDQWKGAAISVTGNISGTITGPSGLPPRDSGTLSGTATSAQVLYGQNLADVPAPLLDILNHPDHFHLSAVVTGGNENLLDFTATFDPPSPLPSAIPEPTALATLVIALSGLALRHRLRRRDHER